jgi:hypothetical protein
MPRSVGTFVDVEGLMESGGRADVVVAVGYPRFVDGQWHACVKYERRYQRADKFNSSADLQEALEFAVRRAAELNRSEAASSHSVSHTLRAGPHDLS